MTDRTGARHEAMQAATAACIALALACGHTGQSPPPAGSPAPPSVPAPLALVALGKGLPHSGQWRNGFALADMDGDGHIDLVHGPARKGPRLPVIFLGDGKGGFRHWETARFPPLPYDYGDVVAGDLDGDRRADLALAMHLSGVVALRNEGGGAFSELASLAGIRGAPPFSSRAIEAADWDGDGRQDLAVFGEGMGRAGPGLGGGSFGLRVFLNRAGGWAALSPPAPGPGVGDSLARADLDGDGWPDALTPSGGASRRALLRLNRPPTWEDREVAELRADAAVGAVAAADCDADGASDLLLGYLVTDHGTWFAGIDLLLARDGRYEVRTLLHEHGRNPVRALAVGDLDGDRAADVVALRGDGTVQIFASASRDRASALAPPAWRRGCSGYGLRLGDLDGDRRPEVLASFAGEPSPYELGEPTCVDGGGIEAWAVVPAAR